jgi:molecular chaperone DnaK
MVKDAELHADEDKKRRELVELRNNAEGLIHSTERTIKESGDKIPAPDKEAATAAIAELRTALEGEDNTVIAEKQEALSAAALKLGEAVYKATQAEAGPASGPEAAAPEAAASDSKVVDADFEEVDDRKKGHSA